MRLIELPATRIRRPVDLDEPGFDVLAAEVVKRYVDGRRCQVLMITDVFATVPGQGSFWRLVVGFRAVWPGMPIVVVNVATERFKAGLVRMGFRECGEGMRLDVKAGSGV